MAAIGYVTRYPDTDVYKGQIRTLSIRTDVEIVPNRAKSAPNQPDYRVLSGPVELGAGWIRTGEPSGKDYVSLAIAAPEFGPSRIYVNSRRASQQDAARFSALTLHPAPFTCLSPPSKATRGVSRPFPPSPSEQQHVV